MGRKKTEFTTEQDVRITQMVNDGHSLNEILDAVNSEFETNFSRSGIDRRIKTLGIDRTKIVKDNMTLLSRSDIIKYTINKWYYNASNNYSIFDNRDGYKSFNLEEYYDYYYNLNKITEALEKEKIKILYGGK